MSQYDINNDIKNLIQVNNALDHVYYDIWCDIGDQLLQHRRRCLFNTSYSSNFFVDYIFKIGIVNNIACTNYMYFQNISFIQKMRKSFGNGKKRFIFIYFKIKII